MATARGVSRETTVSVEADVILAWTNRASVWVNGSIAVAADGTIYMGVPDGLLYALRPDGEPEWILDTGLALHSTPAIAEDGTIYLAMEFIEGESLNDLLTREGALTLDRAAGILKQTGEALQAAHDLGIVHRDLKPDNIMLSASRGGADVVKVVEKGITPRVNTGIAHKDAGVGQIGAGLVRPPMAMFEQALVALAEEYGY